MKRNNIYLIVSLVFSYILLNCTSNTKREDPYEEARSVYEEAIVVHDEVMPKMDKIMQLQKSLRTEKEKLTDETLITQVDSGIAALEEAHDRMMQWMRNIPGIPEYVPKGNSQEGPDVPEPEEMMEIQSRSLAEIKEVQEDFEKSIRDAETLLDSLNE